MHFFTSAFYNARMIVYSEAEAPPAFQEAPASAVSADITARSRQKAGSVAISRIIG
jgi:hypothetical protein